MATAVEVNRSGETLTCSICRKVSKEMVLSSCFHSFCSSCLEGHVRSLEGRGLGTARRGQYTCPICHVYINFDETLRSPSRPFQSSPARDMPDGHVDCDVCGLGNPAVNRCMQCGENFCENCTKAHLKMKVSRYHGHRVLPIRRNRSSSDDMTSRCPRHPNEEIIVVCTQCDVFLCHLCKLLEHENHVTRLVSEEAGVVRRDLSTLLQEQAGLGDTLQLHVTKLRGRKERRPKELEQELQKVRHQSSLLHLEIAKDATEKEQELVEHYDTVMDRDAKTYDTLQKDCETYSSLTKEAQRLVDNGDDFTTVQRGRALQDGLHQFKSGVSPYSAEYPTKTFAEGVVEKPHLREMVGRIEDIPRKHKEGERTQSGASRRVNGTSPAGRLDRTSSRDRVSIQEVSSFALQYDDGVGYVYGIAPATKDHAWITLLDHPYVRLVNVNGDVITSFDMGESCDDVASDHKGGCYVTCQSSKSVKHIVAGGQIEPFLTELGKTPYGISVLPATAGSPGEVYICLREHVSGLAYAPGKNGAVRVFSETGEEIFRGVPVQAPVRIAADGKSGLLCVSDHCNGCVMVCANKGGPVKALYTGEESEDGFKPLGVCFDQHGCIVLADWGRSSVLRVTGDGELVQAVVTDGEGPQAVAVDGDGQLWLGCKRGRVQVIKLG